MKKVWNYAMSMWQPVGALAIGIAILGVLYTFRLGSLVAGISSSELAARQSHISLHTIFQNPINAPYKVASFLAQHIHNGVFSERLISAIAAVLSVILFYMLARHFSNKFAAGIATVLFGTSTALLSNGRLALPNVTLLLLLFLFACGYRLRFSTRRGRTWLITAFVLGISLYTPGLLYFVIAGAIWQFRSVKRSYELPSIAISVSSALIATLLVVPLIVGFVTHPGLIKEYLLIPKIMPTIKDFALELLAVPAGVLALAPKNAIFRLGRQPVLDAGSAALLVIGVYTLFKRYKLDRFILFTGIFILTAILTAISGNYEFSFILVPFVYLVIAIGVKELLETWRIVFPNNPLARTVSVIAVISLVVISVNFQLRRYFVAWPHNDETRAAFQVK